MSPAEHHAHIALAQRHTFGDDDIETRIQRSSYAQSVLSGLLARPSISYSDAARAIIGAADNGTMSHAEALHLTSKLPSDPVKLHAVLSHLHQVTSHSFGLLSHERNRRTEGTA